MIRALLASLGFVGFAGAAQADCGDAAGACDIETGSYHIDLPQAKSPPMVVFLHGYGGNGAATMRNKNMRDGLIARGYAVMAPNGSQQVGEGRGLSWNFFPGWEGRDESAFLSDAVADAVARFNVDSERVILGGFSAGGFMVSYLACATPDMFSAYTPVSGGFWRPHPTACSGPVRMFHTHGWTDNVVPLEGRKLGGGRFQQGDIFAGLEIWRAANACSDNRPSSFSNTGPFMRRKWAGCADGSALELALFPGGHQVPQGWADMVVDWYEGLPGS